MPEWLMPYLPEGWTGLHLAIAGIVLGVSSALVSILIVGYVLTQLPADYFVNPEARGPAQRHPVLRVLIAIVRNVCGYLLIGIGVVLSFPGVPGQGILTILMGVMLIDFPGKHRAERWLLTRRGILTKINAIRTRMGKPPLLAESARSA